MENIFNIYNGSKDKISSYFNNAPIHHNIIFNIEVEWTDFDNLHNSVSWEIAEKDSTSSWDFDEWGYGIEIYGKSRWESIDGKYTLFVGDNGCGDRDCYVFKNSLKVN